MTEQSEGAPARPDEGVTFPVDSIDAALPHLRRPFSPAAVKWKVQATSPKGKPAERAIMVGYIDARLVSARLNKVVGGNWSEKPVRVADQPWALMYELTVFEQTHTDVGVAQGRSDDMKLKAMHSDGLKRPAVRFGIGEYLYAMPQVWIDVTEDGSEKSDGTPTIKRTRDGKVPGFLPDAVFTYLRERYEAWLKAEGEEAFGKPLDHGDAATGSVGYEAPDATPDEGEQPPTSEPLEDEKAKALGAKARELRDEIREVDPDALPQQSFDSAMQQREHSHDRLADFIGNLTELLADLRRFEDLREQLAGKLGEADLKKVVDRAQRRASRRERVEVLEKALAETTDKGGGSNGE